MIAVALAALIAAAPMVPDNTAEPGNPDSWNLDDIDMEPGSGPTIQIHIDNADCARPSAVASDAEAVAHAAPDTSRRAYLYDGWNLIVRCRN